MIMISKVSLVLAFITAFALTFVLWVFSFSLGFNLHDISKWIIFHGTDWAKLTLVESNQRTIWVQRLFWILCGIYWVAGWIVAFALIPWSSLRKRLITAGIFLAGGICLGIWAAYIKDLF